MGFEQTEWSFLPRGRSCQCSHFSISHKSPVTRAAYLGKRSVERFSLGGGVLSMYCPSRSLTLEIMMSYVVAEDPPRNKPYRNTIVPRSGLTYGNSRRQTIHILEAHHSGQRSDIREPPTREPISDGLGERHGAMLDGRMDCL